MALPMFPVDGGGVGDRRESDMQDDMELIPESELPELALMIDVPS
ncbi:hypothetical protein [Streptomyces sp. SID3343]|nr:hypothetical protein [Streptomyces sp. SID3343]